MNIFTLVLDPFSGISLHSCWTHFQEYLYTRVGPALMRSHFADWAAHTAAELDYLTREQVIYHATIFVFLVIYKYVIWIYKYLMLYVKSFKKVDRGYLEIDLAGDWDLFRPSVWTAQVSQSSSSLSLSLSSWPPPSPPPSSGHRAGWLDITSRGADCKGLVLQRLQHQQQPGRADHCHLHLWASRSSPSMILFWRQSSELFFEGSLNIFPRLATT